MAFPFGSHILPLINLVHKLASALPDTHFSFLSTAKSNNLLSTTLNGLPSNIKAYDIDDGVPIDHVPSRNPVEPIELFIKATPDNFKKGFEIAIAETNLNICCLITDGFLTFAGAVAEEMGVPWIPLWGPFPHAFSVHLYVDMINQFYIQVNDGDNSHKGLRDMTLEKIPGLSKIHVADLPQEILSSGSNLNESPFAGMLNKLGYVLKQSTIIVMNYCQELYPPYLLGDLKSKFPKLLNVGFLTLAVPPPQSPSNIDPTGCLSWLDGQKALSVVYISLGTVAALPPNEFVELAEALEATGVPFIWSLKDEMKQFLPNQFIERTKKQGKVVPWAPQAQVLAHSSTGVFVTHFGSNSVSESIANGVPMIGRPIFGDHHINGRIVEEIEGIGVRVDGGITKDKLIKSLELVLVHEQGKEMRRKGQALREVWLKASGPNGSATQDFKSLVEEILML